MILAVANTKGGVGKTTVALNIAIQRAIAGRDVWLVDGDRQATASTAIAIRSESHRRPAIACSSYPDGVRLRSQVLQQCSKFQDVVIDVGGRDSSALRAALVIADIVLVPFQPRSYDVWALQDIAQLVVEAQSMRDGLKAYAVLNCADPAGSDNSAAAQAVAEHPHLVYLDAPLHRRKAYANAAGAGMSVTELRVPDQKAAAEVLSLVRKLYVTDFAAKIGELSVTSGEESVT
ncbi:AAA family ATPase [Hydrocarboniphaga effusa]|jgi:chromosome partitioning protein|uniref:AAA family ATPase n=1 Tax=Hydrocarboniphaga effusa TaxID=243629 RepID=UPI003BAD45F9